VLAGLKQLPTGVIVDAPTILYTTVARRQTANNSIELFTAQAIPLQRLFTGDVTKPEFAAGQLRTQVLRTSSTVNARLPAHEANHFITTEE
jgi:hypothetical protein